MKHICCAAKQRLRSASLQHAMQHVELLQVCAAAQLNGLLAAVSDRRSLAASFERSWSCQQPGPPNSGDGAARHSRFLPIQPGNVPALSAAIVLNLQALQGGQPRGGAAGAADHGVGAPGCGAARSIGSSNKLAQRCHLFASAGPSGRPTWWRRSRCRRSWRRRCSWWRCCGTCWRPPSPSATRPAGLGGNLCPFCSWQSGQTGCQTCRHDMPPGIYYRLPDAHCWSSQLRTRLQVVELCSEKASISSAKNTRISTSCSSEAQARRKAQLLTLALQLVRYVQLLAAALTANSRRPTPHQTMVPCCAACWLRWH